MRPTREIGRRAGILWLLQVVTGGPAMLYVRSSVLVPGDAAATAARVTGSEPLFRAAIVGTLLSQVFFFFLGLTLFHLFEEVDRRLARVLVASVLTSAAISVVNTGNHLGALIVLSQADFLKVFDPAQLKAMAMVFLRLAYSVGQGLLEIFWVPYYVSFGLLIIRSRSLPKIFGILLTIMGVGFAVNLFQKFLIPRFHPAVFTQVAMALGALGGIPTMLWLLVRGAKEPAAARS